VGARYLVSRLKPDFAIIGEPSQWDRVTLGYKGSAWAEITVRRERAHTASQNESASEAAVKTWLAIQAGVEDLNEGKQRAFDRVLLTLRGLSSAQDGFNEWASLQVGVRLPPGLSPGDWYAWLAQICPGAQIRPSGFPMPAYQGEKNNPLVRAFLSGIRTAGGKPGFVLKTGSADLNIVAPAWGCPAVAYGPGDSALDHTPNEHLDLEEYERAVEVLVQVLRTLTQ
jgi:LysW-gamma-L-lysine carboxypeptidase